MQLGLRQNLKKGGGGGIVEIAWVASLTCAWRQRTEQNQPETGLEAITTYIPGI